jgi:hypothetical protein
MMPDTDDVSVFAAGILRAMRTRLTRNVPRNDRPVARRFSGSPRETQIESMTLNNFGEL